jgi:hypothetical protein
MTPEAAFRTRLRKAVAAREAKRKNPKMTGSNRGVVIPSWMALCSEHPRRTFPEAPRDGSCRSTAWV